MKKAVCGLMMAGVTTLSGFAEEPQATRQDPGAAKPSIAEGEKKIPTDTAAVATSMGNSNSIMGKRVFDMSGTEIGRVQDLVVDLEKGELGYVVLEVKTEDGPRKLPVPSRALKAGVQPGTLVLNISQAVLAATEVYRDEELPEPNAFSVDETAAGAAADSEQGTASSEEQENDKESQAPDQKELEK